MLEGYHPLRSRRIGGDMTRRSAWALAVLGLPGCTALPPAHFYEGPQSTYENAGYLPQGKEGKASVGTPGPAGYAGRDFCRDVENRARVRAVEQDTAGWAFGIAAVVALGAGTALTASADSPSDERRVGDAALPLVGAALGYVAFEAFARGKDAGELTSRTASSLTMDDKAANDACNNALAAWSSSRTETSKPLRDEVNQRPVSGARTEYGF
jgi:hypothetical protein